MTTATSGPYWAASQLDLPALADGAYDGVGIGVHTLVKQPVGEQILDADNRNYNSPLLALRRLGERGFALLTGRWRSLRHITTSPRRIGAIVEAALDTPPRARWGCGPVVVVACIGRDGPSGPHGPQKPL
ncbi:transposase [Saccharopolyspora spinosa]|uniref:transposase n=1 Tax=Saccharopolyspora spinosa TaxID=60894 RepID=UPI0002378D0C|nr:transposase [Saccharopolyspora spinosa]